MKPRKLNKLTVKQIEAARPVRGKTTKRLADGGGLSLLVKKGKHGLHRYWQFRFDDPVTGKAQLKQIGPYPRIGLAKVRELAEDIRDDLDDKVTPKDRGRIEHKEIIKARRAQANTFQSVAEKWYTECVHDGIWKSKKYERLMWESFDNHVLPHIGDIAIADITATDLKDIVRRIARAGTWETCQRVLQRVKTVFQWAEDEGLVGIIPTGPAQRWIKNNRPDETKERNYPSLHPNELPELVQALEGDYLHMERQTYLAIKLQMLTFLRPGELRHLEWTWVDLKKKQIEIPARMMKMKRPHIVPLNPQAIEALKDLQEMNDHRGWVFPGKYTPRKPISEGTVNNCLKRLKPDADGKGRFDGRHTAHSFRHTASTYLNEYRKGDLQPFRGDPVELQLAHLDKNMVRRRYNKATHLDLRREMMDVWGAYCDQCADTSGNITPIKRKESR